MPANGKNYRPEVWQEARSTLQTIPQAANAEVNSFMKTVNSLKNDLNGLLSNELTSEHLTRFWV